MSHVTSPDGTSIAFIRQGSGPAVIMVGGGLDDGAENAPLAAELAADFTVYNYARRGRGESGDTQPYALEREIDDIDALIAEAGGSAHLYGVSSGGALALEATAAGLAVDRLAVYEAPYGWPPPGFIEEVQSLVADGRRGDAVALFMRSAGSSEGDVEGAKTLPFWPALEAIAHTLAYDAACMSGGTVPAERFSTIEQPTLVMIGGMAVDSREGMGGLASDFFDRAANAIASSVPNAERRTLEGQGHMVEASAMAPVVREFFAG